MSRLWLHAMTGAAAALAAFAALFIAGALTPLQSGDASHAPALAAAFALGFLISAMAPSELSLRRAMEMRFLAALNPALVAAALVGPSAVLAAAASLIVWRGVFALAVHNDHRATILLALALALAPLLSVSALAFYPALLLLSPLLSPWGLAPRRAAGFFAALIAPLILVAAGGLFLLWLAGASLDGWALTQLFPRARLDAQSFLALLAAPGLIFAAAGLASNARVWKAALIFFASGASMVVLTGAGAVPAIAVVAAGHAAFAAHAKRPLILLAAGFFASGALVLAELSPVFSAATAELVEQALTHIAPARASP